MPLTFHTALGTEEATLMRRGACAGRFHDDQFLWRRHDTFRDFVFDSQAAAVRAHTTQARRFRTQIPKPSADARHGCVRAARSWRKR